MLFTGVVIGGTGTGQRGGLLLYTDGVNEAVDAAGDEFGFDRLHEVFLAAAPSGADAVLAAFQQALADFVGGSPQRDDITIIVVEKR